MRKAVFAAAFAALAFSAQAVITSIWQSGDITTGDNALPDGYWGDVTVCVTASFVLDDGIADSTELVKLYRDGNMTANYATLKVVGNQLTLVAKGGFGSEVIVGDALDITAGKRTTISFTVQRGAQDVPATVTFFANGQQIGEATTLSFGYTASFQHVWLSDSEDVTFDFLASSCTEDGDDLAAFLASAKEASVMPEPTAVALLALGVAGAVLRRRTA